MARKPKKSQLRLDFEAKYRKLAKRADQRLVRLEELSGQKGFENVMQYAYRVAMRDIRSWSGSEARRFNTRPPKNTAQLKAKIADIEKFLNSVTSTKSGIVRSYDTRVNAFNKKYGTDFSSEELAEFFRSSLYKKAEDKKITSDTIFRSVAELQANEDQIKEAIENHQTIHFTTSDEEEKEAVDDAIKTIKVDDMHVQETLKYMMHYQRRNITRLFDAF